MSGNTANIIARQGGAGCQGSFYPEAIFNEGHDDEGSRGFGYVLGQKSGMNEIKYHYPIPENPAPKIFMDTDTNLKLFLKYLKNNPIDFYLPGFAYNF